MQRRPLGSRNRIAIGAADTQSYAGGVESVRTAGLRIIFLSAPSRAGVSTPTRVKFHRTTSPATLGSNRPSRRMNDQQSCPFLLYCRNVWARPPGTWRNLSGRPMVEFRRGTITPRRRAFAATSKRWGVKIAHENIVKHGRGESHKTIRVMDSSAIYQK